MQVTEPRLGTLGSALPMMIQVQSRDTFDYIVGRGGLGWREKSRAGCFVWAVVRCRFVAD